MIFLLLNIVLAFILFVFALIKLLSPSARQWQLGNKIPGPKPLPLLGNCLEYMSSRTFLETFDKLHEKYGPVVRIWMGNQLLVSLMDPEDMAPILSGKVYLSKPSLYRLIDSWLGKNGLLTGDVHVWQRHRKQLNPIFSFKAIKGFVGMMQKNARILCDRLASKVDQSEFDIQHYIDPCALNIICEAAMGLDLKVQSGQNCEYLESLNCIKNEYIDRLITPWLHPEILFKISSSGRRYYKSLKHVKDFVYKVIHERRNTLIKKNEEAAADKVFPLEETEKSMAFLDYLLCESNFTNEEIEDEVQTFMFAGHDTTSAAISFCLFSLSQNMRVQDALAEEIRIACPNQDTELTYQDYMDMPYLDNVVKETLRMYPSAPLFGRKVDSDLHLSSGYVIPSPALVSFSLISVQRNSQYFENADQFMPERFSEESNRHRYAYLPFSAGPRSCIGQKYALLELKVIIVALLRKYRFLPAKVSTPLRLDCRIVTSAADGIIPVKIAKRD